MPGEPVKPSLHSKLAQIMFEKAIPRSTERSMPGEPVKPSLHSKLAQIMFEAERIPKNGQAPKEVGGYKFVQVGDAADFIRKALAEKSISMLPSMVEVVDKTEHLTKTGNSMTTVDLRVTWTLTDGITGETATIVSYGAGGDTGDKYSGKATTSAMKYALLAGFLLSTGDDTEAGDSQRAGSSRAPSQQIPGEPALDRPVQGLIGTVEVGKAPVDMQVRKDMTQGDVYGFKLKNGSKAFQCLAVGPLAEELSLAGLTVGTRVTVEGSMVMVPWEKDGQDMPPFSRVMLSRVHTPDWTLPAVSVPDVSPGDVSDDEAAEILRLEMAEATA